MRYPPFVRGQIVALHESGLSNNKIAQQLGKRQSSISRFLRTYKDRAEHGPLPPPKRRRLLSQRDERLIKRAIQMGECQSAVEIARQAENLGLPPVSETTVRRALKRQGLVARSRPRKPALTALHKVRRLEWARRYQHWTVGDWEKVIFSDETKMVLVNAAGRSSCWRGTGECPFSERLIRPTKKFGGGSIMVWGCMTAKGVGNLCRIFINMTAPVYVEILERHMQPSTAWVLQHPHEHYWLQQDNDPKHTSAEARRWLAENHVDVLSWPSQSPDLNPIEHLWTVVKNNVRACEPLTSMEHLWERLERVWWSIKPDQCRRLVQSMPDRIQAVIKARGGHTRF